MTKQYSVLYARKYQSNQGEKTHWMHVGKAFDSRNGGLDVVLHVMPFPGQTGEVRILIREEDEADRRDQGPPRGGAHSPSYQQPQRGGYGPQSGSQGRPQHRETSYRQPADVPPMPGGDDDQGGADGEIPF